MKSFSFEFKLSQKKPTVGLNNSDLNFNFFFLDIYKSAKGDINGVRVASLGFY